MVVLFERGDAAERSFGCVPSLSSNSNSPSTCTSNFRPLAPIEITEAPSYASTVVDFVSELCSRLDTARGDAMLRVYRRALSTSIDNALRSLIQQELAPLQAEIKALRLEVAALKIWRRRADYHRAPPTPPPPTDSSDWPSSPRRQRRRRHKESQRRRAFQSCGTIQIAQRAGRRSLLEEHGKPFTIREYLVDTPSFDELSDLRKALKLEPIEWARTMDAAWCEHFDNVTIFDDILPEEDDIFRAMAKLPIMIERPILWRGERAVIGRPPERILELLDDE